MLHQHIHLELTIHNLRGKQSFHRASPVVPTPTSLVLRPIEKQNSLRPKYISSSNLRPLFNQESDHMPRDLSSLVNQNTLSGMSDLAPADIERDVSPMDAADESEEKLHSSAKEATSGKEKRNELHPYTQTLSLSNLESCVALEEAAFPPQERASRGKLEYRLKNCGELFLGLFTSQTDPTLPTAQPAAPVYSGAPDRKAVLLGYIGGTKTTNPVVKDEDMAMPSPSNPDPKLGHKETGKTVCIHSLGVLPEYQKRGLGTTLMKAYVQRIESHKVADRLALIAHDHLIPYYEKFGFVNKGKSEAQFGGGGWYDMVREFGARKDDD